MTHSTIPAHLNGVRITDPGNASSARSAVFGKPVKRLLSLALVITLAFACAPGLASPAAMAAAFPAAVGEEAGAAASFSALVLHPNIETIGVLVTGTDLPKSATLHYRPSGQTEWRTGHPLMRMDDGRLAGSLFGLAPAATYEIKVVDGSSELTGSAATQTDELTFAPVVILHVDDDAPPGGDGSASAPFKSIQP
jgi:hypothetical protein